MIDGTIARGGATMTETTNADKAHTSEGDENSRDHNKFKKVEMPILVEPIQILGYSEPIDTFRFTCQYLKFISFFVLVLARVYKVVISCKFHCL